MTHEAINYGVDEAVLYDNGRLWYQVEQVGHRLHLLNDMPLEEFPEGIRVTEGYDPSLGETYPVDFRQIEFSITLQEMQSAPIPVERLFEKAGITEWDEVEVTLRINKGHGFSWGIRPREISERKIGASFIESGGLFITAPYEKLNRTKRGEVEIETHEEGYPGEIPFTDRFRKAYGTYGYEENFKWRNATLLMGARWVKGLLEDRLGRPLEEPTISPVELVEKLRKAKGEVQIGHPITGLGNLYYGSLEGEDYYHILFEISDIPQVELLAAMQSRYHSIVYPKNNVLAMLMGLELPAGIKVLSEVLSVCDRKTRKDLINQIERMDEDEREDLIDALATFDDCLEAMVLRGDAPTFEFSSRTILPNVDERLINDLVEADRRKWVAIKRGYDSMKMFLTCQA